MKKKVLTTLLAATTTLTFALTGCGTTGTTEAPAATTDQAATEAPADTQTAEAPAATDDSAEGTVIKLVNNKAEIQEGLAVLADTYKEQTGVTVSIDTIGGGQDTQAILKNYYQAGDMPDIFVFEGDTHYETWKDLLADLSDEAWTKDTEAEYVGPDGHVYGFPTTTEAIGLSYNKSILDKAGIDPKSITGPESMRAAFEKIDSMKDELGLTAVVGYYTESANLWWTAGQHLFGTYLDSGLARNDTTYLDLINDGGKLDPERIAAFADMVALFNEYTDPLGISGSYDDQVLGFASGKYAFVTQGSWIGASMTTTYADQYAAAGNFEVGMIPYAFIEGQDTIQTNSPNWWGLYKDGNVDAAKAFIQWCSQNDGGQQILAEKCGCVSPFVSSQYAPADPYAKTIADYTAAGKTSAWHWQGWKAGLAQNVSSVIFQDFAKGSIKDTTQFVDTLQKAVEAYYAQQ